MKIGIIGAGRIGGTLAKLFSQAGHQVLVSNSRGPLTLESFAHELGPGACPGTVQEAADFGEVVVVSIPYGKYETIPAKPLAGKIVVDTMNYYPRRDGEIRELANLTSTELLGRHLPGARLVKTFNTMPSQGLATGGKPEAPLEERLAHFVAADDPEARGVVERLIEEIGFTPVPTGSLREGGRKQQPGAPVYGKQVSAKEGRQAMAPPTLRQ